MAATENLRQKLAMAVKSIQWSYAIFWSISSTEPAGVLTWCDGYYNGDIKTRKTVKVEEMKDEEDEDDQVEGLQRTEQLRQLYESLSAPSEYEVQAKRPSAALSPEDLSDTEWYFLVCMTFEFSNGQGLPGRTLAKNTISWLSDAHIAHSNVFSRSLLAKSASIQTVVCFPYLEGVVEFGITEKVLVDQNMVKQIKALLFGAPQQNILEIPLETCSGMLDHDLGNNSLNSLLEYDQNLVTETHNSPKNSLNQSFVVEDVQAEPELSWQFVDAEEEGEVLSYYHNNSVGSNDIISQNLVSLPSDLSKVFKNTQRLILGSHFRRCDLKESAFVGWKSYDGMEWSKGGSSQTLVKKALYQVPRMHDQSLALSCNQTIDSDRDIDSRFSVLRSLVPSRGKVDGASLLDDTIDYLKALERKVEALESDKLAGDHRGTKRKGCSEGCLADRITVTAVEKGVAIEIRCRWRENMMVEVFDAMSSVNLEAQSVHSSTVDGILTLSIESKMMKKSCTALTGKTIRQALERVMSG